MNNQNKLVTGLIIRLLSSLFRSVLYYLPNKSQ